MNRIRRIRSLLPLTVLSSLATLSLDDVFRNFFRFVEVFEKARKIAVLTMSSMIERKLFHILFQKDCRKMQMGLVHPKVIC
ncbi:hypothetical protein DK867_11465 [Ochrobactrum sp. POC9]|uniref:hypothetical protein n=1 Tax=unclassified Ochrobactrum TaxID=239106 RepID=UPI000D70527A|nr:hypothetical protein [Ochrobactrum sp. POC9]MCH4539147.1 hypothetical protein [Ochrobactrum sp. A-1]PWU73481.1 hypothetical protein DK867_11465 [Ochrobactrum sp. POC9]